MSAAAGFRGREEGGGGPLLREHRQKSALVVFEVGLAGDRLHVDGDPAAPAGTPSTGTLTFEVMPGSALAIVLVALYAFPPAVTVTSTATFVSGLLPSLRPSP